MSKSNKNDKFYRNEVVKDFKEKHGKFAEFSYGANSITGWRLSQEDRFVCLPFPEFTRKWSFFAIYDGHGGEEVAEYLKRNLHHHILTQLEEYGDIKTALSEGFKSCDLSLRNLSPEEFSQIKGATHKKFSITDYKPSSDNTPSTSAEFMTAVKNEVFKEMLRLQTEFLASSDKEKSDPEAKEIKKSETGTCSSSSSGKKSLMECMKAGTLPDLDENETEDDDKSPLVGFCCGSTATVVVFTDEIIYVANVGDSRCIASVNGTVKSLSRDHRPLNKSERKRILESGHKILRGRIDGGLNMSRAFGDYALKMENVEEDHQAVIVEPTLNAIEINPELDFIILASDGIWNNMENDDVISFVSKKIDLPQHELAAEIFEHILSQSKNHTGQDNMSIIIIKNELSDKNTTKKVESKDTEVKESETTETKEMDSEEMTDTKTETKQPVVKKKGKSETRD